MRNQSRIYQLIRTFSFGFLLLGLNSTNGQTTIDSGIQELTFIDLSAQIKNGHPLLISAELADDLGRANLRAKRGAFDPQMSGDRNGTFSGVFSPDIPAKFFSSIIANNKFQPCPAALPDLKLRPGDGRDVVIF
jgi:hypothetical protein